MLSVICFSKDRPLQLDAFLASLHFFSALPYSQISVIYTTSAHISYEAVIHNYPDVVWIRESAFIDDFRKCVAQSADFIMLCCDDMVFKDYFTADTIVTALKDRPDALAFSLKLGANLHSLPRLNIEDELLSWNWRVKRKGDWHYPWDVSGCVYRRELVTTLSERYHDLSNPNRLEWFIAAEIHDDLAVIQNTLLCFRTSKCIILTINRVQDEFENDFDASRASDPVTLYAAYCAGKRLYWPAFALKDYSRSHINGRDFRLAEAAPNPTTADVQPRTRLSARSLSLRIACWGFASSAVNVLRSIVPARLLSLVWKSF